MKELSITVAMCFVGFASYVIADEGSDSRNAPIWAIFKNKTDQSVNWERHEPNPRFAISNAGTRHDHADDLVWDKETGLIWERAPQRTQVLLWRSAKSHCIERLMVGRYGGRLPTVEELASIIDPSQA